MEWHDEDVTDGPAHEVGEAELMAKVVALPGAKLDGISRWMLANGIALTRRNWCEVNWGFDKTAEEIDGLVAGRGHAEELAEIPCCLSVEDGTPKARVIPIRRKG